jgi:serine/threonine protein kinase
MRLPRTHGWVFIDMGISARIGERASVAFTIPYAAPEAAIACVNGEDVMEVTAALDAWALGVTAFELLVGRRPFGFFTASEEVRPHPNKLYHKLHLRCPSPRTGLLMCCLGARSSCLGASVLFWPCGCCNIANESLPVVQFLTSIVRYCGERISSSC